MNISKIILIISLEIQLIAICFKDEIKTEKDILEHTELSVQIEDDVFIENKYTLLN